MDTAIDQALDDLLDAAYASGLGPRAGSFHYGYLKGWVEAVATVRGVAEDSLLTDLRRRRIGDDARVTAAEIGTAVDANQLLLRYQPKVSLRANTMVGMEA